MMEEKQQSKKPVKGKLGKKVLLAGGAIVALVVIAAIIIGLSGGVSEKESEVPTLKINTPYIDLQLPLELQGIITNDESTNGTVFTCAFYMHYGAKELPLWRFDFGDPNAGDWVGMLKTDKGDIPVVMTGFAISAEELAALGEEGYQLYGECMQGYSVMLDGIMSDPRFTGERPLAVGEDTDMKLRYWNVTLPDTMDVLENSENGNYEAVFYGEVIGEMVPLYRICIGEEQAKSFLGYYEVDGVRKAVSVESFELEERDGWSQDDYAAAYRMMDTINHVIETIVQSEQFSENAA